MVSYRRTEKVIQHFSIAALFLLLSACGGMNEQNSSNRAVVVDTKSSIATECETVYQGGQRCYDVCCPMVIRLIIHFGLLKVTVLVNNIYFCYFRRNILNFTES